MRSELERIFVQHQQNRRLARVEVYTEGKTPAETRAEIVAITQAARDR